MNRAVLYLDFDGVLHPDPVYRHHKRGIYLGAESIGHMLFENVQILQDALAPYPQLAIVLSTSWVRVLGYSRAKAYLPEQLRKRVIGATFHSCMNKAEFDAMTRGAQVLADARRRGVAQWLAIDDDSEGWLSAAESHLVLTDEKQGLAKPESFAELAAKLQHFNVP